MTRTMQDPTTPGSTMPGSTMPGNTMQDPTTPGRAMHDRTMVSPRNPEELIELALTGDLRARDALVDAYRDPLDRHVRLRLGAHLREKVEVEDVTQETFARALASLGDFRWQGEGSFLKWLKAIAENAILALAKKSRRDQVLFVEPRSPPVDRGAPSPSVAARREERFERLRAALDGLEPDHREVIVLARLEGLRLSEVARRMGRSPNAVAHLLSRALARLKEAFGETESLGLPHRRLDVGGSGGGGSRGEGSDGGASDGGGSHDGGSGGGDAREMGPRDGGPEHGARP